eukprot:TRINITY_DN18583_c0_g1_i12.p1 TRINITY_DN18583_c0_g1~~TRINITY_DN18583_c0_g1_i12.p1  ORF type:complete len:120 (+),score=1.41 TRINITY_DN18583_c0_g1_i12:478-837(+)
MMLRHCLKFDPRKCSKALKKNIMRRKFWRRVPSNHAKDTEEEFETSDRRKTTITANTPQSGLVLVIQRTPFNLLSSFFPSFAWFDDNYHRQHSTERPRSRHSTNPLQFIVIFLPFLCVV